MHIDDSNNIESTMHSRMWVVQGIGTRISKVCHSRFPNIFVQKYKLELPTEEEIK